jgi:hypothetical protein
MIPQTFIDYYGDQTRWFIGEVINVADDPLQLGRAQVRAFGVYDNIKDEDLPWAQIVVPVTTGIHEGKGQNLGMLVGTQVFGIFLDGQNSQLPMVIGTVPKEGDTNEKAKENYPLNKVYETERGHFKEYDDTEGKERIREQHRSGTNYEIFKEGDRTTLVVKDERLVVLGDKYTVVAGHDEVNVTGNVKINVTGNALIAVKEDVKVTSAVSIDVSAPSVTLRGDTIKLNS